MCDSDFYSRLSHVVNCLAKNRHTKIVSLSGPTCSGKTTAAKMLAEGLESQGRAVHIVSIDDFYFDRDYLHELSRKSGSDIIDYDSASTIDLDALKIFVAEATRGEAVHCPVFDFRTGTRQGFRTVDAEDGDVFIFEGIQAVYPEITQLFAPVGYEGVYIAPMTALRSGEYSFEPNEIRLLRRIVRDANFRNTDAEFTFKIWESVRANEEKNIFPHVDSCAYKIDSTHAYELGVLKPFLERQLGAINENSLYFEKAGYILSRLADTEAIDASVIEDGSLYREFV